MNKGSADKWCEQLLLGQYKLNDGYGLRYGDDTFCLAGVLQDFASGKSWTFVPESHSYMTLENSSFLLSKETIKRCKIKTNFESVYDFHRQNSKKEYTVSDIQMFVDWINTNYQTL